MKIPGFTADASLYRTRQAYGALGDGRAPDGSVQVSPQLGIGGGGVTGPADGEEYCYVCSQWVRVPCGLTLG